MRQLEPPAVSARDSQGEGEERQEAGDLGFLWTHCRPCSQHLSCELVSPRWTLRCPRALCSPSGSTEHPWVTLLGFLIVEEMHGEKLVCD